MTETDFRKLLNDRPELSIMFNEQLEAFDGQGITREDGYPLAQKIIEDVVNIGSGEEKSSKSITWAKLQNFGPSTDLRKDYIWVNDNRVGVPDWDTCPSNGARNLYADVTTNKQSLAKFNDSLHKVLPSGSEAKELQRKQDDGRELVDLAKKVARAKAKAMGITGDMVDAVFTQ